jgi:hypothetical protein
MLISGAALDDDVLALNQAQVTQTRYERSVERVLGKRDQRDAVGYMRYPR